MKLLTTLSLTLSVVITALPIMAADTPATLPADYQETLTNIFKKHESFDTAAEEIRNLAIQNPVWQQFLADPEGAHAIITASCVHYIPENINSIDPEDEFAAKLCTTGSFEWYKKKSIKNADRSKYLSLFLAIVCEMERPDINFATDCLKEDNTIVSSASLISAAASGHTKLVELLLNYGADIETESSSAKATPLTIAALNGQNEVVDLLITRKANINTRLGAVTPLQAASLSGSVACAQKFIAANADLNAKNHEGFTALQLAQSQALALQQSNAERAARYNSIIELLKDAGAQE